MQADLRARRSSTPRCAGSASCRRCRSARPAAAPRGRSRAGPTRRRRPGRAPRRAARTRRRSAGSRPCRRAPRATPGRARSRCPRPCGGCRPRGHPSVVTARSMPLCFDSCASMWSKNGTPVEISRTPVPSRSSDDEDLGLLGDALDLRAAAHPTSVAARTLARALASRRGPATIAAWRSTRSTARPRASPARSSAVDRRRVGRRRHRTPAGRCATWSTTSSAATAGTSSCSTGAPTDEVEALRDRRPPRRRTRSATSSTTAASRRRRSASRARCSGRCTTAGRPQRRELLVMRVIEHALHGWDLARAIGADEPDRPRA